MFRRIWKVCRLRLQRRDDLRDDALLVLGEERQPCVTCATPAIDAICCAALCWNVSCVPGRKKSCTKCVPGLPSFERSVTTDRFALDQVAVPAAAARRRAAEAAALVLLRLRA